MANLGGRLEFDSNLIYKVINPNGTISDDSYTIVSDSRFTKSDRLGHVLVNNIRTNKHQKVNQRRVLPSDVGGKIVAIESTNGFKAICSNCKNVIAITRPDSVVCPNCGNSYELYWIGNKPASIDAKKPVIKAEKIKEAPVKNDTQNRIAVDFESLKVLPNCELYTKSNIKFDHPNTDVKAHILLFVGDCPRKLCFNTYNGLLGKKQVSLYVDEFIADTVIDGFKRAKIWYSVKDLDVERKKIVKDGFEKQ